MNLIEIFLIECGSLVKLVGALTIGFAFGSYIAATFNFNTVQFIPTAEFILFFCIGYLLIKVPIMLYLNPLKV